MKLRRSMVVKGFNDTLLDAIFTVASKLEF